MSNRNVISALLRIEVLDQGCLILQASFFIIYIVIIFLCLYIHGINCQTNTYLITCIIPFYYLEKQRWFNINYECNRKGLLYPVLSRNYFSNKKR